MTRSSTPDGARRVNYGLAYGTLAEALRNVPSHGVVQKPWGNERVVDLRGCVLKVITVNEGHRTSLQSHEVKQETIFVLESHGNGGVYVYGPAPDSGIEGSHKLTMTWTPTRVVRAGDVVDVEPGIVHRSVGPVILLEVTTRENWDVVRWEDDYGRSGDDA